MVRLLAGRNTLRRPVDRIEGAALVALSAAFLVAVAVASISGTHTYQLQRGAAAGLRPGVALLIQDGPPPSLTRVGQAEARWHNRGGSEESGVLTTVTAPGIAGAAAGTQIPVWLNRSGQLATPPAAPFVMILYALIAGAAVAAGAGMTLLIFYGLCRLALDRRRLAAWESAWALIGPQWTTRR
jgi:hypothetical protein